MSACSNTTPTGGPTNAAAGPPDLFVTCEGSGAVSPGWCQMCSIAVPIGHLVPAHVRLDVLAMVDRGDYDV